MKIFLSVLFLASSFGGNALDLPFGEDAWRNHSATNSFTTVVNVFQLDPETYEHTASFSLRQQPTKFSSYEELLNFVRGDLLIGLSLVKVKEAKFNPEWPAVLYITTRVFPSNTLPPNFGIHDFIFVELVRVEGGWAFPEGFLDNLSFEYDRWQVLQLKDVARAKIVLKILSTGTVREEDTQTSVNEDLLRINSKGSLLLRQDLVFNNPNYEFVLTVTYKNGKTDSWDQAGKLLGVPAPPKISIAIGNDGEPEMVVSGTVGQRVTVEWTPDLKSWTQFIEVTLTNSTQKRYPIITGTNDFGSFRLRN